MSLHFVSRSSEPRPVTRGDHPDNFGRWKNSVEKGLNRLFTRAASAAPATVGSSGTFLVRGLLDLLGSVSMKSEDGNELFRLGDMTFGRGLEMKRDDASLAFRLAKQFSTSTKQAWSWGDKDGNTILAENAFVGGLSQPFLEHVFAPIAAASGTAVTCGPFGIERTTASPTFETLFVYDGKRQNGFLDLKIAAVCSDGTTAAEVQVVDMATGTPLAGFFLPALVLAIPTGTTTMTLFDPTPDQVSMSSFPVGSQMRLGIQARRSAGAGSITLAVAQAIGG